MQGCGHRPALNAGAECVRGSQVKSSQVKSSQVHVHVNLPSRQDAPPQVPWRHSVEDADTSSLVKFSLSSHVCEAEGPRAVRRGARAPRPARWPPHLTSASHTRHPSSPQPHRHWLPQRGFLITFLIYIRCAPCPAAARSLHKRFIDQLKRSLSLSPHCVRGQTIGSTKLRIRTNDGDRCRCKIVDPPI
jgi:hypothetical protein